MNDTVYVIGHKNPDTDSVVSAAAYAHLKRELGLKRCVAARAGKMNPQAEYVFERFDVPFPAFIPDLVPKVEYYLGAQAEVVDRGTPLWDALATMNRSGQKALPIVDGDGRYRAMLHYSSFAQNILNKINPHKKAVIPTSVSRLAGDDQGPAGLRLRPEEQFKARILVAALETDSFKRHLDAEAKDSVIIIVGDRVDVQRYAIESKVRAVIITNGALLDREPEGTGRGKRRLRARLALRHLEHQPPRHLLHPGGDDGRRVDHARCGRTRRSGAPARRSRHRRAGRCPSSTRRAASSGSSTRAT